MKAVTTSEVLDQFRAALSAREIVPPDSIIADGRLRRCNAAGSRGTGDAAYLLHLDGVEVARRHASARQRAVRIWSTAQRE